MYLVFDCETGGLTKDYSLLTSYFAVYDKNFAKLSELDLAVKPDDGVYRVCGKAMSINKIDLVKHDLTAIDYKSARTKLYNFLNTEFAMTRGEKLIPLGQNVSFDIDFVVDSIISKGAWDNFVTHRVLDTMLVARFLQLNGKLDVESVSLGNLVTYFGIEVDGNPHEARYDALATVEVYKKLVDIIK